MSRVLLSVVLAGTLFAVGIPAAADEPVAIAKTSPLELAKEIPARLESGLNAPWVAVRVEKADLRRAAATLWVREAMAPLEDPLCAEILRRQGFGPERDVARWAQALPLTMPVALAPLAKEVLVPAQLPAQSPQAIEMLQATGVLPFEVALSGEWARAVAARHAGPPLADPALRAGRAARLEGVARLAGIALMFRGSGVDPQGMGAALVSADRSRSGFPREALLAMAANPVERAYLLTFLEDGFHWIAYHYLRGGVAGLLSAVERPLVFPAELLRPGRRISVPESLPEGCSLGPRAAAALLTSNPEAAWTSELLADRFWLEGEGKVRGLLVFESDAGAMGCAARLERSGHALQVEGKRLELTLTTRDPVR